MKTPNKRCYLKEGFVCADQQKITKLTQTCFTRRGLEISGWPMHMFTPREILQSAIKQVCIIQTKKMLPISCLQSVFVKNLSTQRDSYWVANEDKGTIVAIFEIT